MCGLAGFSIGTSSSIDSKSLLILLFEEIKDLGKSASGAAWHSPGKPIRCLKGTEDKQTFKGRLERDIALAPKLSTALLHTRRETKGSSRDAKNNHPVSVDGVFGVHAGDIDNEEELYGSEKINRVAEVDSAVIFHLVARSLGSPWSKLKLLKGTAAVAWIAEDRPAELHVAKTSGEEVAVGQTSCGTVIFANHVDMITRVCSRLSAELDWVVPLPDDAHLVAFDGRISAMDCQFIERMAMCDSNITVGNFYLEELRDRAIWELEKKIFSTIIKIGEDPETFEESQLFSGNVEGQKKDRKELARLIETLHQTQKTFKALH